MSNDDSDKVKYASFIGMDPWVQKHLELPTPAGKDLPDWYKQTSPYPHGQSFEISEQGNSQATVKHCMPILDIISTGWIQKTWCDIYIQKNSKGEVRVDHSYGPKIINYRDIESIGKMPIPKGYLPLSLLWRRPWRLKTPLGHSVLYTHPFHRSDLPFIDVPAVVDTDNYHSEGNVPFFLHEDFSGLIPKGTPMYQIIPFKKDAWVAKREELDQENIDLFEEQNYNVLATYTGAYKRDYWNKPKFSVEESQCPIDNKE